MGHRISVAGATPDSEKVSAIQTWPIPTCAHDIQVFLGMTGFYAKFVKGYAIIAVQLTNLLSKQLQ